MILWIMSCLKHFIIRLWRLMLLHHLLLFRLEMLNWCWIIEYHTLIFIINISLFFLTIVWEGSIIVLFIVVVVVIEHIFIRFAKITISGYFFWFSLLLWCNCLTFLHYGLKFFFLWLIIGDIFLWTLFFEHFQLVFHCWLIIRYLILIIVMCWCYTASLLKPFGIS
jgi:hypothetical protein